MPTARIISCFLLVLASFPSYAGYYATGLTGAYKVGLSSSCYLTPSMAVYALYSSQGGPVVTDLTLTGGTLYFAGYSNYLSTFSVTPCNAAPLSTALPTFVGAASDPVIESGNLAYTGVPSGGGSSSSATIDPLNPTMAIDDSLQLWGLGMVFLASVWAMKRIYKLFSGDTG